MNWTRTRGNVRTGMLETSRIVHESALRSGVDNGCTSDQIFNRFINRTPTIELLYAYRDTIRPVDHAYRLLVCFFFSVFFWHISMSQHFYFRLYSCLQGDLFLKANRTEFTGIAEETYSTLSCCRLLCCFRSCKVATLFATVLLP